MGDLKFRVRDGCRGGREQFTWNSLKEQEFKDRECYLGQSTKVGMMGKFGKYYQHDWYSKRRDTAETIESERQSVQQYEEELMQEALGLKPKRLLLSKKQLSEEEFKELIANNKNPDKKGMEAMGPQKKIVKNEYGEQVAASNEDFIAEAFRDAPTKGLGFASHRDAKLEKIKADVLGARGELKGTKIIDIKDEDGDDIKREVKTEVKMEVKEEEDDGPGAAVRRLMRVKEEAKEAKKRKREEEGPEGSEERRRRKQEKKLKKAEKKLKKKEKKAAKMEKKAAKEKERVAKQKAAESSSSSDS